MDHEVLKKMEKALGENKTLETLTLRDTARTLSKEFCRHILFGIGLNKSLSILDLSFGSINWVCFNDGRLVYVSHMLCDSV